MRIRNSPRFGCFGDSQAGQMLGQVHPHLAAAYPDARVEKYEPALLDGIELVFAALPHGHSQAVAPEIIAAASRSSISAPISGSTVPRNIGAGTRKCTGRPSCSRGSSTAFPELHRDAIKSAKTVAAAGCYASTAILALKPLVEAGAIAPGTIIVDAASGVSGAGKGLKDETHFNTVDENFTAYGLLNHRHTGEMEMELGSPVLFTPHLAPINRGILATCYGTATGDADPLEVLRAAYAGERFIHVSERIPRPNGRWDRTPSTSPPVTTRAPAACSSSRRSTIS